MITVTVTSESPIDEILSVVELLERIVDNKSCAMKAEASKTLHKGEPVNHVVLESPTDTFNATELAEAEQLGKSASSTVGVEVSQTAHADMTVNTSTPAPTSVFGQPAQITENVANPVAPPTESPVRDADGLLWDKRIHSSSKELNKDGTWRRRRGVEPEYIRQCEGEQLPIKPTFVAQPSTLAEVTPATEMTFPELLDAVTKAMVAGQLNQARIAEALQAVGMTALPNLIGNPQLIPAFRQALGGVV